MTHTTDTTPNPDRFDPNEPFDINRDPPATAAELAIQTLYRDLAVPAPPADAWDPLLQDLADRQPATQATWADLAERVRAVPPPPVGDGWTARAQSLRQQLDAREQQFNAQAAWLTAQTKNLAVPPPSADQWAFQTEALQINLARLHTASDRIEKLARETPVLPATDDDDRQTDWLAVEHAIRQGHTETPPPVAPQRWDRMWQRIHTRIVPPTAAASPDAAAPTAARNPATAAPTAILRPRHGWIRWAATGAAAAAALALVTVALWRASTTSPHPATPEPPAPQTAILESAEILDMGNVDDSVTTVVRTTSGDNPVTVVVIVNQ